MAEVIKSEPFKGSITGVWVSEVTGKPILLIETLDGKTYTSKVKEVWPGKAVGKGEADEEPVS